MDFKIYIPMRSILDPEYLGLRIHPAIIEMLFVVNVTDPVHILHCFIGHCFKGLICSILHCFKAPNMRWHFVVPHLLMWFIWEDVVDVMQFGIAVPFWIILHIIMP